MNQHPLSPAHRRLIAPPGPPRHSRPRGFTLVEMLIALTLTLILVYAIAHFYAIVGDAVKDGRGMIEMNQQLRAVVERLKDDLDRLTVPVVPWADEGGAEGYFEIREGLASDWDVNYDYRIDADSPPSPHPPQFADVDNNGVLDGFDLNGDGVLDVTNLLGDTDDFIAMTIRASGAPFKGQSVNVFGLTNFPAGANDGRLVCRNAPAGAPTKITNPPVVSEISAPFAEVAWWTSFADAPDPISGAPNQTWDLNETRFLHRRQLLIRPDLNVRHAGDATPGTPSFTPSTTPYFCRVPLPSPVNNPLAIYQYDVQQYCDISLRVEAVTGGYLYFVANSLADLSKRQNRFMHVPAAGDSAPGVAPIVTAFPYVLDLNPYFAGDLRPDLMPDNGADLNTTSARHNLGVNGALGNGSLYRWVLMDGGRKGEDIMLPNLLAFDIRVYDPDAVLRPDAASNPTGVLQPGDPGYAYAVSPNGGPYGGPFSGMPSGAYVDIGYGIGLATALTALQPPRQVPASGGQNYNALFNATTGALGSSRFAGLPHAPTNYVWSGAANVFVPGSSLTPGPYQNSIGFTYDTWTKAYERDGINQDGIIEQSLIAMGWNDLSIIVDQGTDGLDNLVPFNTPPSQGTTDYRNGVDDAGERETSPPYPFPLRAVQIRIRMYEPGTRQMRQATVIGDFLPE